MNIPAETFAANLILSALLGGIIGMERDLTGHPAGLRTEILIAISSCLFTMLSISAFEPTSQVASQVVTGVGFLGAGAVLRTKNNVHGLTSAATIWLVAAIGMSIGCGRYGIALATTGIAILSLHFLAPVSGWLRKAMKPKKIIRPRLHRPAVLRAAR